jgi:hypothetical protein
MLRDFIPLQVSIALYLNLSWKSTDYWEKYFGQCSSPWYPQGYNNWTYKQKFTILHNSQSWCQYLC